jgi:hypothetical protein
MFSAVSRDDSPSFRPANVQPAKLPVPAGRDNISIVPLEWLSGKLKKLLRGYRFARFGRHQPLL